MPRTVPPGSSSESPVVSIARIWPLPREELPAALESRAQVLEESRTEPRAHAERDLDAARSRRGEMDTPGVNTLIADSALWSPDGGCGLGGAPVNWLWAVPLHRGQLRTDGAGPDLGVRVQ